MRRALCIGLLGLAAAAFAGLGFAASTTVSLTAAGPQPPTVTVEWGDTVDFTNADTVAHTVVIPRFQLTSPAIAPGSSFQHVFTARSGNYSFRQTGGTRYTGTVTVRVSGTITLVAARPTVKYGQSVTISGRSTQQNSPVTVKRKPFGSTGDWVTLATLPPPAGGTFSIRVKPTTTTQYQAFAAGDQVRSRRITVSVAPRITIKRPRTKNGFVTVVGRIFPAAAAKRAILERSVPPRRSWRGVAETKVGKNGSVTLRWRLEPGRSRLRIALRRRDVSLGYEAAASSWVLVSGPPASD
jgi:plastocyanin